MIVRGGHFAMEDVILGVKHWNSSRSSGSTGLLHTSDEKARSRETRQVISCCRQTDTNMESRADKQSVNRHQD